MSYLHLLSESDNDDIFYEAIAEKVTEKQFEVIPVRVRKGEGSGIIMQLARRLLFGLQRTGKVDDTYFLLSIDNDRAPQYDDDAQPSSHLPPSDKNKPNRHKALLELALEILGSDRKLWPVKGAIAVPVEMLESWLLLGCDECEATDLPIFSSAKRPAAKAAYAPQAPPPQLKDLVGALINRMCFDSTKEFLLYCATERISPDDLRKKSRSFCFFHDELLTWKQD